jgi:GTP-binding protein EngB required for normal cell division
VVERAQYIHYQDCEVLMAKIDKLHKEIHMVQIEVHKLQLQVNTKWEVVAMANQAKVKLYDQLVERGLVEL